MSELTIDGLKNIMREAAGEDDASLAGPDIQDTPFDELGFDSLALLETVALIKRTCGVTISSDDLIDLTTPGAMLSKVNAEPVRA